MRFIPKPPQKNTVVVVMRENHQDRNIESESRLTTTKTSNAIDFS